MVPPERIGLHEDEREKGEDRERDNLLDDLELPNGNRPAELRRADAVGRDLETIFQEGDSPAQQHDSGHPETFEPRFERDMPVPRQRHESVRHDEQPHSNYSPHRPTAK